MKKERLKRLKKERRRKGATIRTWKKERAEFAQKCKDGRSPEGGELANFMDGLTPAGYDKNGKKVSFVERGKDILGSSERIGGKVVRISKS